MRAYLFILFALSCAAAAEPGVCFMGTVTWSGSDVDFAVVSLYQNNGADFVESDTVYTSGGSYDIGNFSQAWAERGTWFKVTCFLVHDDHTVSTPQVRSGIDWPDDFTLESNEYRHYENFTW